MSLLGLRVLHNPPHNDSEDSCVDIVAVHGLESDQVATWTHRETGVLWLRDLLPSGLSSSRVLAFGYNADASTFFGDDAGNRILQHAHTLVAQLEALRASSDTAERPINFICHGLGGILVKKALAYSATQTSNKVDHRYSIFISTYGIIFLSTPHNGVEKAAWQMLVKGAKGIRLKLGLQRGQSTALTKDSEILQSITDQFAPIMKQFHIYFFWEGVETTSGLLKSYVVREDSAAPIMDNTERSRLHATHSQMCRFADHGSTDFRLILATLSRYAREAQNVISSRWINARKLLATQRMIEASELIGFDVHNHNAPFLCESPKVHQIPTPKKFRNKYFHVPHNVSSIFTGRNDVTQVLCNTILESTEQGLPHQQKRFVLYGLGGSGKTQFCLKFVQDNRDRFWGVFWIDASTVEVAESTMAYLGQLGGLDQTFASGMHWLSGLEYPWLLVIDNADDPSIDYSKFFPAGEGGNILITTRNSDCKIHATVGSHEFEGMEEEDAITLLLKAAQATNVNDVSVRNTARPIVKTLGCLALALIQAGASIRQGICSLEEYLDIFASYKKQILSDQVVQGAESYRYTIYTTWEVSVHMIERLSTRTAQDAVQLLQVLAFLHFEQVPISMFERAWNISHHSKLNIARQSFLTKVLEAFLISAFFTWIIAILAPLWKQYPRCKRQRLPDIMLQCNSTWNIVRFREAIRLLSRFSLVNHDMKNKICSMHPMVHFWARERLNEPEQQSWSDIAVTILADSISPEFEASSQPYRRSLLPHIDSCFQRNNEDLFRSRRNLLPEIPKMVKFAAIYSECGVWQKAITLQETVLDAQKQFFGLEHPETLRAMTALSSSYWNFKRPSEALVLQGQVVEFSSRALGPEDTRTLKAMDTLAATYWLCGQRLKAEKLGQKAVDGLIKKLGPGHPDSLTAMENLGRTYMHRGRYKESQELHMAVLMTRRKMYGPSHPDTLMAMANLGMTHHAQGNLEEAEKLLDAVMETRKQVLGQEHAYTLWAVNDLSKIYTDQGHPSEAQELLTSILEIVTRTLGDEHIGMSMTKMNLARALHGQGKWIEGKEILTDLISMQKRTLGPVHPDTLAAEVELIRALRHLGYLDTAEKMSLDTIQRLTKVMGAGHAWTQKAIGQLSAIYIIQGRSNEAASLDTKINS